MNRKDITEALRKYKYIASSILIDEFGYDIAEIKSISDKTLDTDTVIIGYSISVESEEVIAATHYITLNDLLGADTVILSSDRPIEIIH